MTIEYLKKATPSQLAIAWLLHQGDDILPIPGTPLGDGRTVAGLTPERALKALILFRLLNPKAELRASAGRERYLGPYEPLAFRMVNSIFLQGYLTQPGSPWERDRALWESLDLDVEEGACG